MNPTNMGWRPSRRLLMCLYALLVMLLLAPVAFTWYDTMDDTPGGGFYDVGIPDDHEKPQTDSDPKLDLSITIESYNQETREARLQIGLFAFDFDPAPRALWQNIVVQSFGQELKFVLEPDQSGPWPDWKYTESSVFLRGNPRAYPQDVYWGFQEAVIVRPVGFELESSMDVAPGVASTWHVTASRTSEILRFTSLSKEEMKRADRYTIDVGRRYSGILFIYAVAVAPLLLLLALASQAFKQRKATVTAETAVAVIALLPLRQVLVPSTFTVLTRVDLILAFELLLFIALAGAGALFSETPTEARGNR